MKKPQEKIPIDILEKGIKDLTLIKLWGEYFAVDEDAQNNQKKINKLSTSKIRNFFGTLKKIQANFENSKSEIILLIPKLAYASGRDKNASKVKDFYDLLTPLIENIKEDKEKFKKFVNILEAIVAYHRASGGE